jgi:hypothetical protein
LWPWRHKNLNGIRVNYLHHLDGGVIVLEENSEAPLQRASATCDMIEKAGLEISFVEFGSKHRTPHGHLYYIGIVRVVPAWTKGPIFCWDASEIVRVIRVNPRCQPLPLIERRHAATATALLGTPNWRCSS